MKRKIRLYVHMPFCVQKCLYCDFLSWHDSRENQARYVQALCREIRACQGRYPARVSSLFFGGGTPSVLEPGHMTEIMEALAEVFSFEPDSEMSIEANPGTVNLEKLKTYEKIGLNRISFGLQSAHNEELKALGRIHTWEEFLESYDLARQAGFDNINVDLMSGIPDQTLSSWQKTLSRVLELAPEHVSAYSLIVEEGTPFAQRKLNLPEEEEERRMYEMTAEMLGSQGYRQYEISNYALPKRECAHNMGYWMRDDYLGLGLGAASLFDSQRWNNTDSMEEYLEKSERPEEIQVCREKLSVREQMEETMFLGLRMTEGIERERFQEEFGISVEEVYGEAVRRLEGLGLLQADGGRIYLTRKGISLSNQVFVEFLL
ncbi:MAG: oxygen-independent coproporphyrinogen III oxidase [Lachnospiraceae bacterium]|nr:oxygen-independent coproporphyrinogen III oxidase [Lachnospiraceae bacterium]